MGNTSYSTEARTERSVAKNYATASIGEIFSQRSIHDAMSPLGMTPREARDSEAHPNTVPILLSLDVTASMGHIPHELIKSGLPTLMGGLIRTGLADAALCFSAITDHISNSAPLQIGQFESGDEELDMWLERTWLEGGGGGQNMESYMLAWLAASRLVVTDAWEKRQRKGFFITVGDERNHPFLPKSSCREIFGSEIAESLFEGDSISSLDLLRQAREKWHVYHINCTHRTSGDTPYWRGILGDNLIEVHDHTAIPEAIGRIILNHPDVEGSFDMGLFYSSEPVGEREMQIE